MIITQIKKRLKYIDSFLTFTVGSLGVDKLYEEKLFWKYVLKKVMMKNKITYINTTILNKYNGGKIIIANHVHFTDVILIKNRINCYVVAKKNFITKEYSKLTFLNNYFIQKIKIIPYERSNMKDGKDVKNQILSLISSGENVLVFPEGTSQMNSHNNLLPFKKGLFYLAYEYNIPILPAIIYYEDTTYGLDEETQVSVTNIIENKSDVVVKFFEHQFPSEYENVNDFMTTLYNMMNNQIIKYNKKYSTK